MVTWNKLNKVQLYDPIVGQFFSPDELASERPIVSPYAYASNDPVNRVDPTGMWDDEWEMSTNGEVKWIRESEKHQLFVLDKDGKRTGKFLELKDKTIFDDLVRTGKISNYKASYSIGEENSQTDMLKVFKFAADNTNVEWRVDRFQRNGNDEYSIGTIHNPEVAITSERMGHPTSSVIAFIHSHPDVGLLEELSSIGFAYSRANQIAYYPLTDVGLKTEEMAYKNALYYTYFPKSGNMWSVRNSAIPAFIRNVNSYRGFFFGTLNTR